MASTLAPPAPVTDEPRHASPSWRYVAVIASVFLICGLIRVLHHEMWRDELQAWMLSIDSGSLAALLKNHLYEGHPLLWYVLLYFVGKISSAPVAMQLIHLAIATSTAIVVLRYAPWGRLCNTLVCFGYFPFYEYAVISRNYALGVLFVVVFCTLYGARRHHHMAVACVLFALSQTSVYGILLAAVLGSAYLLQVWVTDGPQAITGSGRARWWGFVAVWCIGMLIGTYSMIPPHDSTFAVGWRWELNVKWVGIALSSLWRSYVPLPLPRTSFWETNILDCCRPAQALLSIPVAVIAASLFARRLVALYVWVAGTAVILLFTYVKYFGYARHHGHLFIVLLAAWWIADSGRVTATLGTPKDTLFARLDGFRRPALMTLLGVQVLAGAVASVQDLRNPFSASKEVARYIQSLDVRDLPIVGHPDWAVSSVAGHLGRPLFYALSLREGTFITWDSGQPRQENLQSALELAREVARRHHGKALLVVNSVLPGASKGVRLLRAFTHSIVPDERYWVYEVSCVGSGSTDAHP